MSLINSTAIPSGATAYELEQSLRFNGADSADLSRTFTATGNRKTWTFSCWVKRGTLGRYQDRLFGCYQANDSPLSFYFNDADNLAVANWATDMVKTTEVYRDTSAWYHVMLALDTTQSTASNRAKIYVNGVQQATVVGGAGWPGLNLESFVNLTGQDHRIGSLRPYAGDQYYNGYLGEVNFVDGAAKVPADFGETGTYGEWKPKEYSGSYGTNGFYLNFAGGGIMSATGGNSTATDGDFKAASFTANGTFTPSADGYVEYLVIGGGGAGAADGATTAGNGGGGAGGYRTGYLPVTASTAYSIAVGAGGAGTTGSSQVNGANSVFSSITSAGGGGGGYFTSTPGAAGGSGGGGSAQTAAGGAANPAGQGNAGETATNGQGGGGGGGAGEAGGTDGTGQGGDGLASSITGSSVTRAGGGGGSRVSGGARAGGTGGGGAGGSGTAGTSGTANTGSGGGAGVSGGSAGSGGSGIVIIRYKFQ